MFQVLLNCFGKERGSKSEHLGMLLVSATENNNLELATYLVSMGANLDFESEKGVTPLILATKRGYTDLVRYILKKGNNPNYVCKRSKQTAINTAAESGHMDIVKLLIDHKANLWDEQCMHTSALHSAVIGGQLHLIR